MLAVVTATYLGYAALAAVAQVAPGVGAGVGLLGLLVLVLATLALVPYLVANGVVTVRREDVAEQIPCGPDLDAIVEAVRPYWEAGFTDIALIQVGGESQDQFLAECAEPLLDKLRSAAA